MTEKEAQKRLEAIKAEISPKGFRSYTRLDLIRFAKFKEENPGISPIRLIAKYNQKYPEKTYLEQLQNLAKGLDMPELLTN